MINLKLPIQYFTWIRQKYSGIIASLNNIGSLSSYNDHMFITYDLPNLEHTFSIIVKTHNYDGTEQLMVLCVYFHFHSLFHLLSAAKYWTAGHYHNDCTYYMVFAHTQCDHINQVYIEALLLERWNLFSPGRSRFSGLLWLLSQLSVIALRLKLRPRNHVDGTLVCTTGHFSFNQLKRLSSYPPPKRHKEGQGVNTSIGSIRNSKHFLAK